MKFLNEIEDCRHRSNIKVEQIYQNMKSPAGQLGRQLIFIEKQINGSFGNKTIIPKNL